MLTLSMSGKATRSTKSQETRTHEGLDPHSWPELDHAQRSKGDKESAGMRTGPDAWIKREGAPWVEAVYVEMGYNSCSEKASISTSAWYESDKNAVGRDLESYNLL